MMTCMPGRGSLLQQLMGLDQWARTTYLVLSSQTPLHAHGRCNMACCISYARCFMRTEDQMSKMDSKVKHDSPCPHPPAPSPLHPVAPSPPDPADPAAP
eukprot:54248-Pelagomonas_calceolata.AAC.2